MVKFTEVEIDSALIHCMEVRKQASGSLAQFQHQERRQNVLRDPKMCWLSTYGSPLPLAGQNFLHFMYCYTTQTLISITIKIL